MAKNKSTLVDLDEEESIGAVGAVAKVVPVKSARKTGTSRLTYDEALKCPHCKGRMHMNLPGATINFECMYRQFNLATKRIETPDERLPLFTDDLLPEFSEWASTRKKSRKNPLAYGKMEAPGGAPTTYAAMKSMTVDDIADEVEVKPKKRKTSTAAVIPAQVAPVKVGKVKPKPANNGKSAASSFSLADSDLELDDEPPVRATRTGKTRDLTATSAPKATLKKVRPEPVQPSAVTTKSSKASAPPKAKTGVKRAVALAGRR